MNWLFLIFFAFSARAGSDIPSSPKGELLEGVSVGAKAAPVGDIKERIMRERSPATAEEAQSDRSGQEAELQAEGPAERPSKPLEETEIDRLSSKIANWGLAFGVGAMMSVGANHLWVDDISARTAIHAGSLVLASMGAALAGTGCVLAFRNKKPQPKAKP